MKASELLTYSFRVQFVYSADITMAVIKDLYRSMGKDGNEQAQLKQLYHQLKVLRDISEHEISAVFAGCEKDAEPAENDEKGNVGKDKPADKTKNTGDKSGLAVDKTKSSASADKVTRQEIELLRKELIEKLDDYYGRTEENDGDDDVEEDDEVEYLESDYADDDYDEDEEVDDDVEYDDDEDLGITPVVLKQPALSLSKKNDSNDQPKVTQKKIGVLGKKGKTRAKKRKSKR